MKQHYKKIDKTSGVFFTAGFFLSKISHLPLHFLSTVFNLIALLLYLVGYLTWLVASFFHPETQARQEKWYGFTEFKKQYFISAGIGTVATLLAVATTLFLSALLIPGLWLYLISNVFWVLAEYHKLKNPHEFDEDYSHTKQRSYFSYSLCATGISLVIALSTTLNILFPPLSFFVVPFFFVLGIGLSIATLCFWIDHKFGNHTPRTEQVSYKQITDALDAKASNRKNEKLVCQDPSSYSHSKRGRRLFDSDTEQSMPSMNNSGTSDPSPLIYGRTRVC